MTIYLYKKTHRKTKLQYLGKTINSDPHAYPGSGTYWKQHLKQHGYDYDTEILLETSSMEELEKVGLYYSDLWNIVKSKSWANLIPETGGLTMTPEVRKKISKTMKGRAAWNKGLKQVHKKHKQNAGVHHLKGRPSPLKGRVRPREDCPHCGKNIDVVNIKRYHGEKCINKPKETVDP